MFNKSMIKNKFPVALRVYGKFQRTSREFRRRRQEVDRVLLEFFYHCSAWLSRTPGCLGNRRDTPLVVSLTTTPARIEKVYLCIESLLRQSCRPDHLLLWISDAVQQESIPRSLSRLTARGLEIRFCRDIRSYTKIIPALREYPEAIVVTADDDRLYPEDWLKELYEAHQQNPACILCHWAHLMTWSAAGELDSYNNWNLLSPGVTGPSELLFPAGTCGVLYPPGVLHAEVLNEEVFMDICPTGDDIWLKAMSLLNDIACKKVAADSSRYPTISGTQAEKLWDINKTENDRQMQAVFTRYGLYELIAQRRVSA
jgi:hypothetical protein